jgi:AsmA protein
MKKALIIVGIVVAVLIVIVIALPFLIDVNKFKPTLETQISTALGRKVTIGNIQLAILSGGVKVDDVTIADDPAFSKSSFLTAKQLDAGVALMPLIFSGKMGVSSFTIQNPQVALIRSAPGKWNFSTMGGGASGGAKSSGSAPADFSIGKMAIKNGTITIGTVGAPGKTRTYQEVDLEASDLSLTSAVPFTLSLKTPGGGTAKVEGKVGPINLTDSTATPLTAKIELKGADLAISGLVDPSSGLAGIVDLTSNVNINGGSANATGSVRVEKLKAAPNGSPATVPVAVDYDTTYDLKRETGDLKSADVHIGKANMHLSGTYKTAGASPSVQIKLNGHGMYVPDLEGILPAVGVALPSGASLKAGSLDLNLSISGPVDKLTIAGPVNLSDGKIGGYNLKSKFSAFPGLGGGGGGSDTEIQSLKTDLRQDPTGTHASNLEVVIPTIGTITGDANVSPTNQLNCKMVAKLSGGSLIGGTGAVLGTVAGGGKNQGIPFTVTGTTSNPVVVPNVGAAAGNLVKGVGGDVTSAPKSVGNAVGGLFGHKKSN